VRRPAGAVSRSISVKSGRPVSALASSRGLAIVAEQQITVGREPWYAQTRHSRRSTLATWLPNTPR
jgi:hypothetical protein